MHSHMELEAVLPIMPLEIIACAFSYLGQPVPKQLYTIQSPLNF